MLLPLFQWFYPRSCLGCGVERPQAFRFLCWECWSLVKRVKATPTQTHLTADERMSNVSSAFEVVQRDSVKGKSVLVVDNVITTGAKAIYVVSVACG